MPGAPTARSSTQSCSVALDREPSCDEDVVAPKNLDTSDTEMNQFYGAPFPPPYPGFGYPYPFPYMPYPSVPAPQGNAPQPNLPNYPMWPNPPPFFWPPPGLPAFPGESQRKQPDTLTAGILLSPSCVNMQRTEPQTDPGTDPAFVPGPPLCSNAATLGPHGRLAPGDEAALKPKTSATIACQTRSDDTDPFIPEDTWRNEEAFDKDVALKRNRTLGKRPTDILPSSNGLEDAEMNAIEADMFFTQNTDLARDQSDSGFHAMEPNTAAIRFYLIGGRKAHLPGLSANQKRSVRNQAKVFTLEKDKLFTRRKDGTRVEYVETKERRTAIMWHFHKQFGHIRREAMLDRVLEAYYWRTVRADIENLIDRCMVCQRDGKGLLKVRDTIKQVKIKSKAWWLVGMDLIKKRKTPRNFEYVLVLIDHYTKWIEVVAIPSKEALVVAEALYRIYLRNGAPHRVVTDNGKEFCNTINETLHNLLDTKRSFIRPYTPRENGMTERVNRSIKGALLHALEETPDDWDLFLEKAAFTVRNRKHRATGFTPHEMFHAFQFRLLPGEQNDPEEEDFIKRLEADDQTLDETISNECLEMYKRFQNVETVLKTEASKNITKEQLRQKHSFDLRNIGIGEVLKIGDLVMFKDLDKRNTLAGKETNEFKGPVEVVKVLGSKAQLKYGKGFKTVDNRNIRIPKRGAPEPEVEQTSRNSKRLSSDLDDPAFDETEAVKPESLRVSRKKLRAAVPGTEVAESAQGDDVIHPVSSQDWLESARSHSVDEKPSNKPSTETGVLEVASDEEDFVAQTGGEAQARAAYEKFFNWPEVGRIQQCLEQAHQNRDYRLCRGMLLEADLKTTLSADIPNLAEKKQSLAQIGSLEIEFWKWMHWSSWEKLQAFLAPAVSRAITKTERETVDRINTLVEWIPGDRMLPLSDKLSILTSNKWLNERVVDRAQSLLKIQCGLTDGLNDSSRYAYGKSPKPDERLQQVRRVGNLEGIDKRKAQVLFVNGNHFLVASNLTSGPVNEIWIYDTEPPFMYYGMESEICAAFRVSADELEIFWAAVERPSDSGNCAVFAIAWLVEILLQQGKPEQVIFDEKVMRNCLVDNLENRQFSLFPSIRNPETSNPLVGPILRPICICRKPKQFFAEWCLKCCEKECRKEFHALCVKGRSLGPQDWPPRKWICPLCRQKRSGEKPDISPAVQAESVNARNNALLEDAGLSTSAKGTTLTSLSNSARKGPHTRSKAKKEATTDKDYVLAKSLQEAELLRQRVLFLVGAVPVTDADRKHVLTDGTQITSTVLSAVFEILRKDPLTESNFCGFLPLMLLAGFPKDDQAVTTERNAFRFAGKVFVQPVFTCNGHYVLAVSHASDEVTVFDPAGLPEIRELLLKLRILFGREGVDLFLEFPSIHAQPIGSNACLVYVAAYMVDTVMGNPVCNAVYAPQANMRRWLWNVLRNQKLASPPRTKAGKDSARTRPPNPAYRLSRSAEELRQSLQGSNCMPESIEVYAASS